MNGNIDQLGQHSEVHYDLHSDFILILDFKEF